MAPALPANAVLGDRVALIIREGGPDGGDRVALYADDGEGSCAELVESVRDHLDGGFFAYAGGDIETGEGTFNP